MFETYTNAVGDEKQDIISQLHRVVSTLLDPLSHLFGESSRTRSAL